MRCTAVLIALLFLPAGGALGAPPKVPQLVFVDLTYPRPALEARISGRVIVRVETNDAGRVLRAESLAGPELLVPAVLANVKRWTVPANVGPIVFSFEFAEGVCHDDRKSVFRLKWPNLAVITACINPKRAVRRGPWTHQSDEEPPLVTRGMRPMYPPIAAAARVRGVVVLELVANDEGAVEARSLSDLPLLSSVAVDHARQWRMAPGNAGQYFLVYEFDLDNNACTAADSGTAFWNVSAGYWRLSGCSPTIQASSEIALAAAVQTRRRLGSSTHSSR